MSDIENVKSWNKIELLATELGRELLGTSMCIGLLFSP